MIDFLVDELKPGKKTKEKNIILTASKPKESKPRMADIVNPANNTQSNFFERKFFKKKPEQKIIKPKIREKRKLR